MWTDKFSDKDNLTMLFLDIWCYATQLQFLAGKMQVEVQGPEIYTAHKTAQSLPRNQWVRILLTLKHREVSSYIDGERVRGGQTRWEWRNKELGERGKVFMLL